MIQFCQQDLQVHTEMYENRETDENSVRDRRCDRLSVYMPLLVTQGKAKQTIALSQKTCLYLCLEIEANAILSD